MMVIYVSAPYSHGNISENVRRACLAGDEILKRGHTPFVPHLSHLWDLISPKSWHTWLQIDLVLLGMCDAFVRLEGESKGADIEYKVAKELCMIIYDSLQEIPYVNALP